MTKKKFKVACFQTTSSQYFEKNIDMLFKMFNKIKNKSVDLVCLPECVAIFTESKKKLENYFNFNHKSFLDFISKYSIANKTFVMIGSIHFKKKNGKFLNRSILIDDRGQIVNFYDKINLFDVNLGSNEKYLESKNFDPGKRARVCRLPWGNLGMSICYDIRFGNHYKRLAKKGADFFSIPAAFTHTTGIAHWHVLVRARAIENGCFVFAPAQSGVHDNGRKTFGHSLIVDPWGKVLSEAGNYPTIITSVIDTKLVEFYRCRVPSMTDLKL